MSNVIEFLERLGSDAYLRQAAKDEVAMALADAKVDASAGEAILARNVEELYALLNQGPLFCLQSFPRKEEEEEEEEGQGEEEQKAPKPSSAVTHTVELA
jgi:CO dehydrogenase/acetyl-CoA synthase beta subunit